MTPEIESRVRSIAGMISRRYHVDVEDLIQEGLLEAWLAIPRYDGKTGSLAGWCSIRARGAMYDYLRRIDPLSRDHRRECSLGLAEAPRIYSLDHPEDWIERNKT